MADHAVPGLPRIALVFGDEAAAAHVRQAIQGHLDIVYATTAASFDATRMAQAHVVAALVNLDGGDWLDGVEAGLGAAGVPVVYNDSEISRGLEGWARARWLRHLLAKLRGSTDVDPPRPGQTAQVLFRDLEHPQVPAPHPTGAFDRPLSPQEIETMTADFVQETAGTKAGETGRSAAAEVPAASDPTLAPPDAGSDTGCADDLDVDTETLSAMIDARLADAEARSPNSTEVWRVVEDDPAPAATPPSEAASIAAAGDADVSSVPPAGDTDKAEAAPSLSSLNDWQLVDVDAEPAPIAASERKKNPEPVLPASLAGLELEPMDVAAPVVHTEPVERWLHKSEPRKPATNSERTDEAESVGDKA